ncbi:unnamed protein product [Clavelina lepadiformis]|uniref:Uncharacterized protein n=1 Tax=Clavelina lepadiformis TaxID=159417 RepID=A0ABP0GQ94_CLALP
MLILNFKSDFTPNPNPSFKWSHFARCDRSLSPNPEDLKPGAFTSNPNPSIKWNHFARCDKSLSPNPEDLRTGIVFHLFDKEQFHHRELVQTPFPTMLTLNFKSDFTPNPNPSFKWSHFAKCNRSLSPNTEDLGTGIVFHLFGKEQFHHRELVQTSFPTRLTLNFKGDFTPNPNPSFKWSHFARCNRSLSPNPEDFEIGIVFNLFGKEQFHHRELVQTLFPTILTLNFKGAFSSNPNPSIKWSHFAICDRSLSPNPEDLEIGIVLYLFGREQFHHRELVQTPFPTILTLNFKGAFTSNPNPSIKWNHFARCDKSLSPNPEDLRTDIVFHLFDKEQFHHRELVQTPFPTMLTLNFKSDFTPNPSFKWSHFAQCNRSLSPNTEDLGTGIVFHLFGKEQFHHRELVQTPFPTILTLNFKSDFTPNPNPSFKWSHFARCDRSLSPNPADLKPGAFTSNPNTSIKWNHFARCDRSLSPNPEDLKPGAFSSNPNPSIKWNHFAICDRSLSPNPEDLEIDIVLYLFGREQFHHRELVQTPFPTILTLNFKGAFTSNPNTSIKWNHFARCDRSLSPNPEDLKPGAFTSNPNPSIKWTHFARFDRSLSPNPDDLEIGIVFNLFGREQFHQRELVQTTFPTMLILNFKSDFTPNPNPSFKWSHFARCDRSLSPNPEDLKPGAFTSNPNTSIKWSHFARCERSLSPNPEDLEIGILLYLFCREQFLHRELVQTPFPTILTLNFKGAFTSNPNTSIKWNHFARCDKSLSPNPEDLRTGIVFHLYDKEQFHHREFVQTPFPTMLTLNFKSDFTPNPNTSIKWSHFARCDRSLSPNPEDLETCIVFNLFGREQFHQRELVQTPFPTILTLNFKGAFTSNPNTSIKWNHFARCDKSLSPNPEDLRTGIVFHLYDKEQFHHREFVQTPFPTMLTLNFKSDFTPNPNTSIKWSHFARCDRSLSPNPEDLETCIVFNLFGREQFHHRELVQTLFPTILTLNFKGAFISNPNPSNEWSHFARCDRSLSPNPENLKSGIVFHLFGKEQFHHRELVQTPFPTILTLNFKGAFTSNPNTSIKWNHFARCDKSLSPNPEDLRTGVVFHLFDKEQFHHRELVQTPFPTMLTLNFKSDFTPNPSFKWSHFAQCNRSLSPNTEDLGTGIVFHLFGREQFHQRELVQTPFPTILTFNFIGAFTSNPNPSIKWSHFARCDRSLSPNPEDLRTGIVFHLFGKEQFHHRELVQTPFPTMLTLNFKSDFTPNPNPLIKWSHFARCDRSLSPNPEDLEIEQFHHRELVQTLFPTILTLNFKGAFSSNPNPSIKWSHFAICDRSLSPNPEDLEIGIVLYLFGREQFHHRELVQTPFPTILTLNFKGAFTSNPNPSIKWNHFARCDKSLSPNPEDLRTGIVFHLFDKEQFHHRELVQTPFPTMLTLNFKSDFTPNPSFKWSHFAQCNRSLSPNTEDLGTGIVFHLFGKEQFHHRELVQTPFPTILTLNFKSDFTPNPNPSFKWSHFARCDRSLSPNPADLKPGAFTSNPNTSIKWNHFARCDRSLSPNPEDLKPGAFTSNPNTSIKWSHFARCEKSLSPNPEDLEIGILLYLFCKEQFLHRELVQTPFPTILTLNFKGAFTSNPNTSIKWNHFARCDKSLSPNPEDLRTGIVFHLFDKEQFHHRELVQTPFPTMLTLNFKSDFTPNPSFKWSHFAQCNRSLSPNTEDLGTVIVFHLFGREQFHQRELVQTPFPTILTFNFIGAFTSNPNPSIKWSHFARCDRSLSPNPENLRTGIVFHLFGKEQFHHRELVQTPFPTMLTLNFKSDFTPNPNPLIKWSHFARCDRSLSPNPEDLEIGIVLEQFHQRELVQTTFPTMLILNFKSDFTPNPNPSFKWSHFARCDRSLSPNPEDLKPGAFTSNPNPSIKWSHFARCDKSLSPNPEDLRTGIVFHLFDKEQFHHRELVQTPFPTMLTLNFKSDFTPNPNPSFKWSHFAKCNRSLSPNTEDLGTGIVFHLFGKEQFHHRELVQTSFPTRLTLNFKGDFTPNPNPSFKWSHFARCNRSLSPNPEDFEIGIVFNLFGKEQFHHRELVQTLFPTILTLNFKGAFSSNPNPSIKWSHFAICDRSLSPNPEDLEIGIVLYLFGREQFHHRELVQTPFPTILTLNFKGAFTSNPNPSIKWNHFARCDKSLSPNPEDLRTGIVFHLFDKEQFHHRELVQTPFPTMLTLNFKSDFTPNPSFKWSHFAQCNRSLSPNTEDLGTGIVFHLFGKEQFHHRELVQTPFPTILTLNFKSDFTPNPNPSFKWSHFARCDRSLSPNPADLKPGAFTSNPNTSIKWSHFARCEKSLSPNPEDLEIGILLYLFCKEQFLHRELVQTPFPTILTLNFKGAFTSNPNTSIKWNHFARCDKSLSPNPEDLRTGIVFHLFDKEQFHHRELVQTPFPTMLTLNFKSDFTPNPNPSFKWSHFARCNRSLSPNPDNLRSGIVFHLFGKEQFHHRELVQTLFPTILTFNFKGAFTSNPNTSIKWNHFARCDRSLSPNPEDLKPGDFISNPNPSIEWSHFARCDRSLSPNPENLRSGIVFHLFGKEQFHHRELVQTLFPTILTLNFKGAFTSNPNPSIKWSHFARCDRSLSPNPEDLETCIVFNLFGREQFHHRELVQTLFPTILTLNFKGAFISNPNPSNEWSHFARCDRSLSPNPENLKSGIVFHLFGKEQFHHRELVQTPFPTILTLNFKGAFTSNPNTSIKWNHFARCDKSLSPNPEDLRTGVVFHLFDKEQFHHRELVQTPFPTMLTLNFKSDFTPNPSFKWSHFAQCNRSLSPNTEDLGTGIVFHLFGREQFHQRELVQTPFPTILTFNFIGAFTSNPNPSIKWSHFARCDRSLSPNPEDLRTGIVFHLFGKEQFHHRELVQTPFPTMLTLNFKSDFTPNPNPLIKWSHFARCDRSLSPNPEDLEIEQFHHRELVQTLFPTILTLNFKGAFSSNPNPSIKWSHFAICDRSLSPNPEDLEIGIVLYLFGREQFHHRELVQTPFPTILTLNFKGAFTSNPNPSIKWNHFARCDKSLSPNPEDLRTGIVFHLFDKEQFHHRELVQTPFPTMLTLNFKSDFTPNPSFKWSHFAQCNRSLSPNTEDLGTGIVFHLFGKEQFHHRELVQTPFPTILTLNFKSDFTPNPNPSFKWSHFARCDRSLSPNPADLKPGAFTSNPNTSIKWNHFARCDRSLSPNPEDLKPGAFTSNPNTSIKWSHFARCEKSLSPNPEDLEIGILLYLFCKEQFLHRELVQTPFPTILTLNFKGAFTSNPNTSIKWNHFARCDKSLSPNPEDLRTGIVFHLFDKEQFHHRELVQTPFPTMLTLNFKSDFTPNPSFKWSHFAQCNRSLSPNTEDLGTVIVFHLFGREQFHQRELVQTPFPTILTFNFIGAFTSNPNPSIKWSHFARCDRSLSPNPENLRTGIVFHLFGKEQFHHRELVQTPFPTMLTLNFKSDFTPNPNPLIKWSHFARCDRSLSPNPEDLEIGIVLEQFHQRELVQTTFPTMLILNFKSDFTPNPNPSFKWSHFARCDRSLSPNPEDLKPGAFTSNPNPSIKWSHFARCDKSLSPNPEDLRTGIVFHLFDKEQFHHRELVQTPFPTMLTLNFKSDFTPNPNPSFKWSHFAKCNRSLSPNTEDLGTGIVFHLFGKEQFHHRELVQTSFPTRLTLNFKGDFTPNPNPSFKWSHFARCNRSLSPNPEDFEIGIVFNLFGKEQFHHRELVQTLFPTILTLNFKGAFSSNPNPSIKWSHFAICDRSLSPNPEDLEIGIVLYLFGREQFHHRELVQTPFPTILTLNFKGAFTSNPNPSIKWNHFARCDKSLSPNPEDLRTGIVFHLFDKEQFHHRELVQTPFPTMLTLNFKSDFTPNPSFKWSHFAQCNRSLSPNTEDLGTGIVFHLFGKEQFHHRELVQTPFPTILTLNFKSDFTPNPNPSFKWSHFARCDRSLSPNPADLKPDDFTSNPNPSIKWSHFARCDRSLSPNPEDLRTGIVLDLFGSEQFHHRELVQTPFPTMLTLNFKSDFTPNPNPLIKWSHFSRCDRSLSPNPEDLKPGAFTSNPNPSIKWNHFARCDKSLSPNPEDLRTGWCRFRHHRPLEVNLFSGRSSVKWNHFARCDKSLSPNPEDLRTGIVFHLFDKEQFHNRELVQTPFPTMLTLNFKSDFTPNPNPSFKWSHFARCNRSLSPNTEDLGTGIVFHLFGKEQFHHRELVQTPFPTILILNFKCDFIPKPNPSFKWSHFARCNRSLSPKPEDFEIGIVFNLFGREQFHHRELVQTPFPTILTLNFKGAFTSNPNTSIKWNHFARCERSLSPNPEDLEIGILLYLFGREQFLHRELVQTPFPTILTLNFKGAFTSNPNPSFKWSQFARCNRSLSPNTEDLGTVIVFHLFGKEQFHHRELVQTLFPTILTFNFKGAFTSNPNTSIKWNHFARCDRSLSPNPEDLKPGDFISNPNPSIEWSHFARCDRSLSPNPENLRSGIVFHLFGKEQFHHRELVQTLFPTILTFNFKDDFTSNPNPSIKWTHFARFDRSLSPNPDDLEIGIVFNLFGREQFHQRELVRTTFPTMLTLNFKGAFTSNPNTSIKWNHFARCDRSLSPNPEDLKPGDFISNPNPSIEWSHFARCDRSLSPNPENLRSGIVFHLFGKEQFHHRELVQTLFPTILTFNFKDDFTSNPNPSIKWTHFARFDRSLSPNPDDLEIGIVFNLFGREQFHQRELVRTTFPTMLTLNFKSDFTPNPNPLFKWSHFARCDRSLSPNPEDLKPGAFTSNPNPSIKWNHFARCDKSLSPNPEDLRTGIVFHLFDKEQFHHRELVQTPFPTMLTLNFKSDFTPNPNPSFKWSHFARCNRSLSPNTEDLGTGIVFHLFGKEQFHHRELVQTPFPTILILNFKSNFTPKPNPSFKWSHFARCDRSLSPKPEDFEIGIVFNLFGREQFHHRELVQTLFPTILTLNFKGAFTSNPNPSIKWSHFAICDRSLSPNPEDLEIGIVLYLFGREQFHHRELVQTLFPTILTLNFKGAFTSNPNPSIKWSHFARCDGSLSPNPEDLRTGIVFHLFGKEQFHHRELVQTPFPTILTLNFKSDFTPNPNPSFKWSHFARCNRSLSPNTEDLGTGIVFHLFGKEQFHHRELVQTPFPTILTLNFKGAFTSNPNTSIKWNHFARCERSLSPNPEDLEIGILLYLFGREQFLHRELVQTPFPTILTLNFKGAFTSNPNPSFKWSHFARCNRSLSPNTEDLGTGIVFHLFGKEQFHHRELVQTLLPTILTFNFKDDFTSNPNPSIKWTHFARFDRSLSPNPDDLEIGIVFNLFGREQFHQRELVQTTFPTMLTLNFKSDFTPNPNPSFKWSHFARFDRSLSPNPADLKPGAFTSNPNPSIKWTHFARFDRSLSPNPADLKPGAFTSNPNTSIKWNHFARCDRSLSPNPEDLKPGAFTSNPNPSIKWNHFARCDKSLSPNPEDLRTGIVFHLFDKEQFHHRELVQTPFPTMLTLNFKSDFTPNPNPSFKWSHFARCNRSLSPNTENLGTGIVFHLFGKEQFHHRELVQTPFPTILILNFKSDFTPKPNPSFKWSHFARCDQSLSPKPEDFEIGIVFNLFGKEQFHHRELVQTLFPTILTLNFKGAFSSNPNPSIKWSHFARCDGSLSPNPEDLRTGIVFHLFGKEQFHHRELVQTLFPTILTLNFKGAFSSNPNPSIKWSHFAICDRSLSPNPEDLEIGIVLYLFGREQFHHRELVQTLFPTILTLNFKGAFTSNPNPSIKWSHFARCDGSLSPNPEDLRTGIVFHLFGKEQFHHRELVQTPFPTILTLNFKSDFTPNPNPSFKWSHFARCNRSLSPNTEDLGTGIVFHLFGKEQFHHRELVQTPFPTILILNFKSDFTPKPNPSFKWSHFARCNRSLSPNPEDFEIGIVFNLFGREQFNHRELVQTLFPTILTLNFKGAFSSNPNPSIKWSHFAICDRSLSPNPEDLEIGIVLYLFGREQFHHRELVQTPFPTILTLNFKSDFTPNPNPSFKWSHFARCDRSLSPNPEDLETCIVFNLFGREQFHQRELVQTPFPTILTLNFKGAFTSNPNTSIKWNHFARCDRSLSPNPEDLRTGIVFHLYDKEQFHHREFVQTPFPTMLTLNFKSDFTPNPSFKWNHFARCNRLLSPNTEDLGTGIVFHLFGKEQFHHRELVQTPFPTILTLNFKGAFTSNPNTSNKLNHFARCDRSLIPNPEDLEIGILLYLFGREQFHHRELVQTPFPTILILNFKSDFTPKPNPSFKWSHFARCNRSLSPNPEDFEIGIVFNLFGREQFNHRELVQTLFPTILTLNFKGAFSSNPNPSIKWSHFAICDRSLSFNPEDLEIGIVLYLFGREQFHHRELVQTPFPTILTLNFKSDFTPNPNPSFKWSHFARCDRSLSPNPEDLETCIVFNLFGREQFHQRELVQTPFPTILTLNFKGAFTSNPNTSIKWNHFARCDRSLSPNPEDLRTGIVFHLYDKEQFHHREFVQTPFPTMLTLNFKSVFTPNPSFKWNHFARCNRLLSPNTEDLGTGIVFHLFGKEQFHHRELVQTPFPTILTLNFKGAFTSNPNTSIKWNHFARCDRSLSPNPEDLKPVLYCTYLVENNSTIENLSRHHFLRY